MQQPIRKFAVPVAAAFVLAFSGAAHAVTPTTQQTEKPADCKKDPQDPRCKDKR